MSDLDFLHNGLRHEDPASSPAGPDRPRCTNCHADLTSLPAIARYCNRCGVRLPPTALPPPRHPLTGWRYWWWGGAPRKQETAFADRSSMFVAYGESLFGLGWRYEHAVGARRNLNEAARCYSKAARLGNVSAADRLCGERRGDLGNPAVPQPPALPGPATDCRDLPPALAAVLT